MVPTPTVWPEAVLRVTGAGEVRAERDLINDVVAPASRRLSAEGSCPRERWNDGRPRPYWSVLSTVE